MDRYRRKYERVFAFVLILGLLCVIAYMAYTFGMNAGEQRALNNMQITQLSNNEGTYRVVVRYQENVRLCLFRPWWLYGEKVGGK